MKGSNPGEQLALGSAADGSRFPSDRQADISSQNALPTPGTSHGSRGPSGGIITAYSMPKSAVARASRRATSTSLSLPQGWEASDHRLKPVARLSAREIYIGSVLSVYRFNVPHRPAGRPVTQVLDSLDQPAAVG